MTDTVIFFNMRPSPAEQTAALAAAHALGLDVLLITDVEPSALVRDAAAEVRLVDTWDSDAALETAVELAAHYRVGGVVTWTDRDVLTVARAAERLGLPGPKPGAASIARNKQLMREALSHCPETIPAFAPVTTMDEIAAASARIGFPAVLKPTVAAGSKGIYEVRSFEELDIAARHLLDYTRPEVDPIFSFGPQRLILERFMEGTEHSVEGFVFDGRIVVAGITDKTTSPKHHLELRHVFPTRLPEPSQESVLALTRNALEAFGMDNCTFHLECMVSTDGSTRLVETAARVGGDHITSHLVPLSSGVSFYENVLLVATGRAPMVAGRGRSIAGAVKVLARSAGTYNSIPRLEAAVRNPYVHRLVLDHAPGDRVSLPPQDYFSGFVATAILVSPTRAGLERAMNETEAALTPSITRLEPVPAV